MRTLLPALLVSSVLAAGCSAGGGEDSSSAAVGEAAAPPGAADSAPAAGSAGGGSTTPVLDLRGVPGLAVVRTAELEVRVDDVRRAADEAGRLARAAGGGVDGEDRSGSGDGGSAVLTLRVPPKAFDTALADLAALGDERGRRLSTEDVTDQVVDLEARLATQRASVDRVRALLGEADALGEVVQIEAELTKRTADLEALEARLQSLRTRVDLSTITLRLDSEGGPVVAGAPLGFGDGLRAGWAALTGTGRVLAVTAGALLPFLPVLLGLGLAWRVRSRRAAVVQP